jgi:hypothetical protein
MNRSMVFGYQLLTGLSDSSTGGLLVVAPALTLHMLRLHANSGALVYLSFVGAFVFSVGLACLYGAILARRGEYKERLEMVWLLTAFTRASVAIFLLGQIAIGQLAIEWMTVAVFDGACVVVQAVGLHEGWLAYAAG